MVITNVGMHSARKTFLVVANVEQTTVEGHTDIIKVSSTYNLCTDSFFLFPITANKYREQDIITRVFGTTRVG